MYQISVVILSLRICLVQINILSKCQIAHTEVNCDYWYDSQVT